MNTEDIHYYKVKEIIRVIDGDTVDMRVSLGFGITAAFRFRLHGVNAYEKYGSKADPKGQEAADFVSNWLDVRDPVKTDTTGLYVRTYKGSQATVGIGDGSFGRWEADILDVLPGESFDNAESLGDALVALGLAVYSER